MSRRASAARARDRAARQWGLGQPRAGAACASTTGRLVSVFPGLSSFQRLALSDKPFRLHAPPSPT
eukprot:6181262-Pleurochrysis_carterae.AAC.1